MRKEFTCDKDILRRKLKTARAALADKPELSRRAVMRVLPLCVGNVMVYSPIGSELDTSALIEALLQKSDVKVFAPYTSNGMIRALPLLKPGGADRLGNLPPDCYGEPTDRDKIDVCITPLLGFNGDGYRIGYGKGCYDGYFARNDVRKIGLAFDCQKCEFLPEPHDVPLDCCVTETKVIYFYKCE